MRFYLLKFFNLIFSAIFVFLYPFIWIFRKIIDLLFSFKKLSIWTGVPIFNLINKCKVERKLGFRSISIVRTSYYIGDEFDFVLDQISFKNKFLSVIIEYISFFIICLTAKQVHAYFDGGILRQVKRGYFNPLELFAYKLLKIKLFVWTYGSDVRTQKVTHKLGEPNCCTDCIQVGKACVCNDDIGVNNFKKVSSVATQIFSMGDMIEYTPKSNNEVFFWPIDLEANFGKRYTPHFPQKNTYTTLNIVHAPNHREFKGTKYLEKAVKELQLEGFDLELVLVEKMSNSDALNMYKKADIIFDQCLIGFYGYFALEGMALGKPVMSFIRKPNEYLLAPTECPIINTNLFTLRDDLRNLLIRRNELEEIGKHGRNYIEKYFSIDGVASRLAKVYKDIGIS